MYTSCRLFTIYVVSLEWSLLPMGMVGSIGFLVFLPNMNSNQASLSPCALWNYNWTLLGLGGCSNPCDCPHSFKSINSTPHWPFFLAIHLWMKCYAKWQFCPHLPRQMFLESQCELCIIVVNYELRHLMMFHPHVKKKIPHSKEGCGCFS